MQRKFAILGEMTKGHWKFSRENVEICQMFRESEKVENRCITQPNITQPVAFYCSHKTVKYSIDAVACRGGCEGCPGPGHPAGEGAFERGTENFL